MLRAGSDPGAAKVPPPVQVCIWCQCRPVRVQASRRGPAPRYCSKACKDAKFNAGRRKVAWKGRGHDVMSPAPMHPQKMLASIRRQQQEARAAFPKVAPPQPFSGERSLPALREGLRPSLVQDGEWRVNIAVHDAWHRETRRTMEERRNLSHPDIGGSHEGFLRAQKAIETFMAKEIKWYAQYGLEVPGK
jgi:hypothetical protein